MPGPTIPAHGGTGPVVRTLAPCCSPAPPPSSSSPPSSRSAAPGSSGRACANTSGWVWIGAGVIALGAYGFVATLQPDGGFGRILAAYGGVFVAGSIAWGMVADGYRPDRWDVTGALICLAGMAVDHVRPPQPLNPPAYPGGGPPHAYPGRRTDQLPEEFAMAATPIAVITGASSGIGAATARQLAAAGYHVVLTARRKDRIEALAAELTEAGPATAYALDVTDRAAVDAFAARDRYPSVDVLVNNAGGAYGADPVATGDPADWRPMYEVNVLGTLHMTQALLPALTASGDGTVVVLSSTAGLARTRAAAVTSPPSTARMSSPRRSVWSSCGSRCASSRSRPAWSRPRSSPPPASVATPRRPPRSTRASTQPLTADDVADTITWAITRPAHVNIDLLVVRPRAQASNSKVHRTT